MTSNITRRHVLAASIPLGLTSTPVWAQAGWPNRPIKIVVPNPAGGAVDIFARSIGEQLSTALKNPVIIDNKAGAGGLIGTKAVSSAAPDGYTLGYLHAGLVTVQALNPKLDLLKELRPVAKLTSTPFVVVVRADSPFKTFKDLVAAVQAKPGKVSFGSGGVGSPPHFAVEMIEETLGNFKALHVPYKAATESTTGVIAGDIDFSIAILGTVVPFIQSGKLRALAVSSRARLPLMPDVPTIAESGVANFVLQPWGGLTVPAGTPDAIIERLNDVLPAIMASATTTELIAKMGSLADYSGAQAFSTQIAKEIEVEKGLVKKLGMSAVQ